VIEEVVAGLHRLVDIRQIDADIRRGARGRGDGRSRGRGSGRRRCGAGAGRLLRTSPARTGDGGGEDHCCARHEGLPRLENAHDALFAVILQGEGGCLRDAGGMAGPAVEARRLFAWPWLPPRPNAPNVACTSNTMSRWNRSTPGAMMARRPPANWNACWIAL